MTPTASHEDLTTASYPQQHIPPSSPFYQAPARLEPTHTRQSSKPSVATNEKDLEAGITTPLESGEDNPFTSKISVDYNKECKMWPSKQTLIENRKAEKKRRRDGKRCGGCGPVVDFWGSFNARQKLTIKIVLALLLIGIAVAIGVGISIAVNGTVYVSDDRSQQIPDPQMLR